MLNSKENEVKEKEVKKGPSGQENETVILGMGVVQHTRDTYRTEGNGQAMHDVKLNDYITIKLQGERENSDTGIEVGD